jgi:hypothetical protein
LGHQQLLQEGASVAHSVAHFDGFNPTLFRDTPTRCKATLPADTIRNPLNGTIHILAGFIIFGVSVLLVQMYIPIRKALKTQQNWTECVKQLEKDAVLSLGCEIS